MEKYLKGKNSVPTVVLISLAFMLGFSINTISYTQLVSLTNQKKVAIAISNPNTTTHDILDMIAVCPASTSINTVNDIQPNRKLMRSDDIYSSLNFWYEFNCFGEGESAVRKKSCSFGSIGQHLLHHAIQRDETLLTVQVGAMNGYNNDPMYEMFVEVKHEYIEKMRFPNLRNWLPVIIEPIPQNYENLIETYSDIAKTKGLGCAIPINAAVSYDTSKDTCPFCRVNTADDAPTVCQNFPGWKKLQVATLDCEFMKTFHGPNFDVCILQDPLPCSSITNLLSKKSISSENIAILQIDIEGYEYVLFNHFLKEIPEENLPPIIHFEHKVMKEQDKLKPLEDNESRLGTVTSMLHNKGYKLHDQGEDYLAVRVNVPDARNK